MAGIRNGDPLDEPRKANDTKVLEEKPPYGTPNARTVKPEDRHWGPDKRTPHDVWKRHGMRVLPRSEREGKSALDAKNYLSVTSAFTEYREMLAAGRSCADVTQYLFKKEPEKPTLTYGTVYKYVQLYRRFFVSPMDLVMHGAVRLQSGGQAPNGGRPGGRIKEKLDALRNGLPELVMMAKVLKTQYDRIKSQRPVLRVDGHTTFMPIRAGHLYTNTPLRVISMQPFIPRSFFRSFPGSNTTVQSDFNPGIPILCR